jgi:hypothetical protein|tara:strand:+ start:369 stop:578 length:210 start_codon:yes stop_codon:yes gene_type:complete
MNSLKTKNSKRDRSLYVSLKLPQQLKARLDDVTTGDTAVYKKTALIRYLLTEFFQARDSGRKVINLAID